MAIHPRPWCAAADPARLTVTTLELASKIDWLAVWTGAQWRYQSGAKKIALVIADISGYTQFIQDNKTSLLHAEEIISQLLEAVIDGSKYPLVLNKLEGDAMLLYAELGNEEVEAARDVARQVQAFFTLFHAKARELSASRAGCGCQACERILDCPSKPL